MAEPLAFRMRPQTLKDVVGQKHLVGEGAPLARLVENKKLVSMIFFGPPGTGKTTLASVLANEIGLPYRFFNAVTGNKKEMDIIFEEAKMFPGLVMIVDEVHRLNKAKQDLLLPHVESGSIVLVGATTANPLHAINPAIRSRTILFEVKVASSEDIAEALRRTITSTNGLNGEYTVDDSAIDLISNLSNGDFRYALNLLETASYICDDHTITYDTITSISKVPNRSMDSDGDAFYDALSGFQKSIRGSDVQAALFYLAILIEADDMVSIERRLLTTAYEDIGLANPSACARATQAIDAAKRIGFPEARIPLSVAVIDLCLSPKSKSAEMGIDAAISTLNSSTFQVPDYLRLTPVNVDKEMMYDYSRSDLWPLIQYLPDNLKSKEFYIPQASSSYEKALGQNYMKLRTNNRSNNLKQLKKMK